MGLFRAYGRFVASLGGVYYTAEAVGTKTSDMNALLSQNRFTTCVASELGGSGNPSPITAHGVYAAMRAGWRFLTGSDELQGVRVAVQGVGNVGGPLVELLDDAGARVWATDLDHQVLSELRQRRPRLMTVEEPDAIFDLDADIFAPCAVAAQVNARTVPRLRARLICGSANNILEEDADAERLRQRGIVYVPDYLCNRMGTTNCADEWQGYLEDDVWLLAAGIYPDTLRVLKHARSQMITSAAAAAQLADIAACELHPLIGHRGRRIIDHLVRSGWAGDGESRRSRRLRPAFDPGIDEPGLHARWEREGRFRGDGPAIAAAPISAAGRPDLSSFLSALLMDVRTRAIEQLSGERPRRVLGSDPGGLALQQAVERTLPFEREEIGRPRFVERCRDLYRRNDETIRQQLQLMGVGFDPEAWLDPMNEAGRQVSRRLFHALDDAGLLLRERKMTYYDPVAQTVLVDPDVTRVSMTVNERFTVRFVTVGGETIETQTFFPELLGGAVALAVLADGPWGHLEGEEVRHPLLPSTEDGSSELSGRYLNGDSDPTEAPGELPIFAVADLATDAKFLVPAHNREDYELMKGRGLETAVWRPAIDHRERLERYLLPGEPPLAREEARRLVLSRLGDRITRHRGRWQVITHRARRSKTLVHLGTSEQLFVRLDAAAVHLRRAIASGAVRFSDERFRVRALELLAHPEPLCISRQYWWGHPMPRRRDLGSPRPGDGEDAEGEVLSVWWSLVAWSLQATGWPRLASPEPIAEVFVDSELFTRWVLPSQLISLAVTGRPAFRRIEIHGVLHGMERVLEEQPGVPANAPDEERFNARFVRRPMRSRLGNMVEPATLVRRFRADALRLGYLLSLHSGSKELATASESQLRRARRTVTRLESKVTGLFHMTRDLEADSGNEPRGQTRLADEWILARATAAVEAALQAYSDNRLVAVGPLLCETIDDFARYSAVAAGRDRQRQENMGLIRGTTAAVIARLHEGFSPVCPHLLERLVDWTRSRAQPRSDSRARWLVELVAHLGREHQRRKKLRRQESGLDSGPSVLGSPDPEVFDLLDRDCEELSRLVRVPLSVSREPGTGWARAGKLWVAVHPGPAELPEGDGAAAWYRSLHV